MCYVAAYFLFALRVEFNVRIYRPVHVFDNISLGLLLDKFTSCQCGCGWYCAVVFYSVVFRVSVYFLLVCCALLWPCVFALFFVIYATYSQSQNVMML